MLRWLVLTCFTVAALVITPRFLGDDYDYGAREMRAAVHGTWRVRLDHRELTAQLDGAREAPATSSARGWIRSAAACGHRTLVRSAEACESYSDLPLEVFVAGVPHASGTLRVFGTTFGYGNLELHLDDVWIDASITPDGKVTELRGADALERIGH